MSLQLIQKSILSQSSCSDLTFKRFYILHHAWQQEGRVMMQQRCGGSFQFHISNIILHSCWVSFQTLSCQHIETGLYVNISFLSVHKLGTHRHSLFYVVSVMRTHQALKVLASPYLGALVRRITCNLPLLKCSPYMLKRMVKRFMINILVKSSRNLQHTLT